MKTFSIRDKTECPNSQCQPSVVDLFLKNDCKTLRQFINAIMFLICFDLFCLAVKLGVQWYLEKKLPLLNL